MRTPTARPLDIATFFLATLALCGAASAQGLQSFPSGTVLDSDSAAADWFGATIAASGDRILVGAPQDDSVLHGNTGSASVYERQGDGIWLQTAKLTALDAGSNHQFGIAVALDGDLAFVGAHQDSTFAGFNAGSVYVFERQGDATWLQLTKLTASDAGTLDKFGASVSLSGNFAIVGAPGDAPAGQTNTGSAYVFERQGNGTWLEVAKLSASDAATLDNFGSSVSITNGRAVVGAYQDDHAGGADAGAAYVFERQGNGSWIEVAKLTANVAAASDWFGRAVAVDGTRVVVTAVFDDTPAGSNAGSAYVFERQGNGTFAQTAHLTASDAAANDAFGWSVALSGGRALVGAYAKATVAGTGAGAAYLYELLPNGTWSHVKRLTASDGAPNDRFGVSVALTHDRAAVGAYFHDTAAGGDAGAAYVERLCVDCTVPYGTGSPGCNGVQTLTAGHAPEIGTADFTILCDNAPASNLGLCIVTNFPDVNGSDPFGLGILLHADLFLATEVIALDIFSDAAGAGLAAAPIPNNPLLPGSNYFACAVWNWFSCNLPPLQLSSTRGLTLTILGP